MSSEQDNGELQVPEAGGVGGADDLNAALTEGEATFVTTEKKQQVSTGTLVVGGLIVAAAAIAYVMHIRTGPAKASAATGVADQTISQFLSHDSQNAAKMRQLLKDTEKAVQQFQQQPAKTQVPLDQLKTNPFRAETGEVSDAVGKAQEKRKKEDLLKEVQTLRVQSIMSGNRKAAMINNALLTEGESVQGFEIEKITADAVIVRKDGSRFALKMQK